MSFAETEPPRRGRTRWIGIALLTLALVGPLFLAPTIASLTGWQIRSVVTRMMTFLGAPALLLLVGIPDRERVRAVLGPRPWRGLGFAWLVTVTCCAAYSALLIAVGAETWRPLENLNRIDRVPINLLAGIAISALEEPVFRQLLRHRVGAVVSSLLYALVHYLRPRLSIQRDEYGMADAASVYAEIGGNLLQPLRDPAPGLGLFLFGMLLCTVARRLGLAWAIGIHSAAVFYMKSDSCVLYWNHPGQHPWFGSFQTLYDGALFCICCGVALAAVMLFVKKREGVA